MVAAMAKHNQKGRSKTKGGFVMLTEHMMKTAAWAELKPTDIAVYLLIARRYNGRNNGNISLSVREASKLGHMAAGTAQKAFIRLQERGLIQCRKKGAFSVKQRHATLWELCAQQLREGVPASHKYQYWQPDSKQNTVSKYNRAGIKSGTVVALKRVGNG